MISVPSLGLKRASIAEQEEHVGERGTDGDQVGAMLEMSPTINQSQRIYQGQPVASLLRLK